MAFSERLSAALAGAEFSGDERTYASREACGTFALAVYDLLVEHEQLPTIVAFGSDPAWGQTWRSHPLGYKLPGLIRRSHLNHVAVRLENSFFDINGEHEALELAETYDANGMIELQRAILRRKMGPDARQPLYFDGAFYLDVKRRLESFLALAEVRL